MEGEIMSKQSSVEFLEIQMIKNGTIVYNDIKKAKQMHKEEILDAFVAGDERGTGEIPFNCEQYYNQTFEQ